MPQPPITAQRAEALIAELNGNRETASRQQLHKIAEDLFPSMGSSSRQNIVREAWQSLHPKIPKDVPRVRRRQKAPGNSKVYDPMPEGMRGPAGLSSETRDRFRAWIMEYVRDKPDAELREIRDIIADRSGRWFGDVDAFGRNYVNPVRERLGLPPLALGKFALATPGSVEPRSVPTYAGGATYCLTPSDRAGHSMLEIQVELPCGMALRVLRAVLDEIIPSSREQEGKEP